MSSVKPGSGHVIMSSDVDTPILIKKLNIDAKQSEEAVSFSTQLSSGSSLYHPGVSTRLGLDAFRLNDAQWCTFQPAHLNPWTYGYHLPAELSLPSAHSARRSLSPRSIPRCPSAVRILLCATRVKLYHTSSAGRASGFRTTSTSGRHASLPCRYFASVILLVFRNHQWAWYVDIGVFFDFCLRFTLGGPLRRAG